VVPPAPVQAIDLPEALRLAGADNPTIALAREAIQAARAELLGARAVLLPTLNAGFTYDYHDGNLLGSSGIIRDVRRQSLYVGAGAGTRAAESVPTPGVRILAHLADAVFEPRAARQQVAARRFDADATRNNVLLDVAERYLALAGAEARLEQLRLSEADLNKVVELATALFRTGQWRKGDVDRASSEAFLLHAEEQNAEGEVAEASARLAELLSLDPATRLRVAEAAMPLLELVDPNLLLPQLVEVARSNRPEVAARSADVALARTRLREERLRPLLPLLSVGFSAGDFGGGSNQVRPRFGNFGGRTDFDAYAVWSLQNLGLGNLALQRERRAAVGLAEAERLRALAQIDREVAEAYAVTEERRRELDVARRQVAASTQGLTLDLRRARNLDAKPIEVLGSLNQLTAARQDVVRALVEYDRAQFRLFVSLGRPPDLALRPDRPCP
jgi:outer membrane protein TolC